MSDKRPTQEERLFEMLRVYGEVGMWVSLPTILDMRPRIASHTKIISNLRARGHDIECEEKFVKGEMFTRYRLVRPVPKPEQPQPQMELLSEGRE